MINKEQLKQIINDLSDVVEEKVSFESVFKEARKLKEEGIPLRQIGFKFNVSASTISYWLDKELRERVIKKNVENFRNKPQEEKSKIYRQRKKYLREYQHKRYSTDPEFRRKQIERSKAYQKNNYKKIVTNI